MSQYKITLTPTGKFFFGGEMRFGIGEEDKDDAYSSYIIKSKQLPQQTSLLGMLRFLLLRNNDTAFKDNKISNKDAAKNLIGEQSFMFNKEHKKGNFGSIKSITPCEIENKNGEIIQKSSLLDLEDIAFGEGKDIKSTINGETITVPSIKIKKEDGEIEDWSGKDGINNLYKDIFEEDCRNGISKDYSGKSQEKAYYMQISYRMKDEQKFVFYADVDVDITKYSGQLVNLGADSSVFIVTIANADFQKEDTTGSQFVVLTSPAFLEDKDLKLADYAITKTETFRFLQTNIETESYNRLHKRIQPSTRFELYSAGSIFCFNNEQNAFNFKASLEAKKEFRQIGYNYYRTK